MDLPAPTLQGGIEAVHQNNQRKAQTVYDAIANSDGFYQNPVDPAAQSLMNVPFTIPSNADLEKEFTSKAAAAGLVRPLQLTREPERSQCWTAETASSTVLPLHLAGAAEGAPLSRRHAGFHLQLDAAGWCPVSGRLHGRLPKDALLS